MQQDAGNHSSPVHVKKFKTIFILIITQNKLMLKKHYNAFLISVSVNLCGSSKLRLMPYKGKIRYN